MLTRAASDMDKELIEMDVKIIANDLARTKEVLGTLIMWIAQSANAPLNNQEACKLMRQLERKL
jgi:hypothetical protein